MGDAHKTESPQCLEETRQSADGILGVLLKENVGSTDVFSAVGRRFIAGIRYVHELDIFFIIALGTFIKMYRRSRRVVRPLICREILHCGLLPLLMVIFVSAILGGLVVGVSMEISGLLDVNVMGYVFVLVFFWEVGPLLAAAIMFVRIGISTIELADGRKLGRVEPVVSSGIDPIYFYVVPRIIGMSVGTFCLAVYLIAFAFLFGYGAIFFQDSFWSPGEYLDRIIQAMHWTDFLVLFLKAIIYGCLVAVTTCYEALAKPLKGHDTPSAVVHIVISCLIGWGIVEVLFFLVF